MQLSVKDCVFQVHSVQWAIVEVLSDPKLHAPGVAVALLDELAFWMRKASAL